MDSSASDPSTTKSPVVESSTTEPPLPVLDWLLVATDDRPEFGMLAQGEGNLEININRRCVFLDPSIPGMPKTPIIFVSGTQLIDAEEPYIRLPNGVEVRAEDEIGTTGGWIPGESAAKIASLDHLDIPLTCWQPENPKREILLLAPFEDAVVIKP